MTHARLCVLGVCAIDLAAPYELLLWSIIDSHLYADTVSLLHAYEVTYKYKCRVDGLIRLITAPAA